MLEQCLISCARSVAVRQRVRLASTVRPGVSAGSKLRAFCGTIDGKEVFFLRRSAVSRSQPGIWLCENFEIPKVREDMDGAEAQIKRVMEEIHQIEKTERKVGPVFSSGCGS